MASRPQILCLIPTRNRYDFLFQCLQSIAAQTRVPDLLVVADDGEHKDFRTDPIGGPVWRLLMQRGIKCEVRFMSGNGQHAAHQWANATTKADLIWRIDDDCIAEPDVLERLEAMMLAEPLLGAAAGSVIEPGRYSRFESGSILDASCGNVQWESNHGVFYVEHLYSSFLYKPHIVNYKYNMSPAAFREETIFSHRLLRAGWNLKVDTSIKTYHLKAPSGGTRLHNEWSYRFDLQEYIKLQEKEWNIKEIHMGCGIGDCIAFLDSCYRDLSEWPGTTLIGSAYPEVFKELAPKFHIIPFNPMCDVNIYAWMHEHNWRQSIGNAFRRAAL